MTITKDDIKKLYNQGSLREIDYFLTETLARRYNNQESETLLAAALTSFNINDNHICLNLNKIAGKQWPPSIGDKENLFTITLPDISRWIDILNNSEICGQNNNHKTPLVLNNNNLYLRRYYNYEQKVAKKLLDLAAASQGNNQQTHGHSETNQKLLNILFPGDTNKIQRAATKVILKNKLLIISGGPGTGKTYTLARLTAMLLTDNTQVIRMAAPTGKAAMRMRESIKAAKENIKTTISENKNNLDDIDMLRNIINNIPENACTIHRLLGTIMHTSKFRHNADNQLPADIVIIDEASMIDLPMMAKILDALQPETKLILLGDMHQLSSVDPGYVLGDICKAAQDIPESNLGKSLVELTYSHRFKSDSSIGQLSNALHNAGNVNDTAGENAWRKLKELNEQNNNEIRLYETPDNLFNKNRQPIKNMSEIIQANHKEFLQAETVQDAFTAINKFRIFSPLRNGPHGLLTINRLIEQSLSIKTEHNIKPLNTNTEFYNHRVIMITRNDYGLKLFNGDIGIVMPENIKNIKTEETKNVVWFESINEETGEKSFRAFPCNMLPEHETSFAMTIHKSQGSQYKNIMIIMPATDNEKLFTKELLYTAITRAEKKIYLWCNEDIFKATAVRITESTSGLVKLLT